MVHSKKKVSRSTDLYILIALILAAIPITVLAHVNFLTSTLLFFGIPSAYLIWKKPGNFKKALYGGLLLGLVLGFAFDFIAEFNHAWGWKVSFALPINFFGIVSLDIIIWYFLWVFLVIAYYEYFIEHDSSKKISPLAKWILLGGLCLDILVVALWHVFPQALVMKHAYAELGTITLVVCALLLYRRPRLIHKVLRLLPFFTFMYLVYEITALSQNLWTFPGAYYGSVAIGSINFPLEELVVWIFASSAIVATYYEFCIDDGK
jgi:hypothetical protein